MKPIKTILAAGTMTLAVGMGGAFSTALAVDDGAGGDEKFSDQVHYSWEEIKAFSAEKSDAAMRESQELVNEMDAALADLEARGGELAEDAGDAADESWEDTMAKLRDMQRIAAKQADALGDASASAWDDTKEGFHDAANAFAEAYDEAERELDAQTDDKGGS